MTQLNVTVTDADKARIILHRLEDVSRHIVATVEGKTIVANIGEVDRPAVQQVLDYYHDWVVSIT